MSGSIKYNGVEGSDFVLARTVALVEQIDYHIPNLTVGGGAGAAAGRAARRGRAAGSSGSRWPTSMSSCLWQADLLAGVLRRCWRPASLRSSAWTM